MKSLPRTFAQHSARRSDVDRRYRAAWPTLRMYGYPPPVREPEVLVDVDEVIAELVELHQRIERLEAAHSETDLA